MYLSQKQDDVYICNKIWLYQVIGGSFLKHSQTPMARTLFGPYSRLSTSKFYVFLIRDGTALEG